MKKTAAIATAVILNLGLLTGTAAAESGRANPTRTHDNPSSCLGAERAVRNSDGGDREHGMFGPAQAATAKARSPYGQWLVEWKSSCR